MSSSQRLTPFQGIGETDAIGTDASDAG